MSDRHAWVVGFPQAVKCDLLSDQHGMVTFEIDETASNLKKISDDFFFLAYILFL